MNTPASMEKMRFLKNVRSKDTLTNGMALAI
jgi:hypothetical protein